MLRDHRGLELTAADAGAVEAFDALTSAYLGMRTDVEARLDDVFAADPAMALAHCLKGAFLMLACDRKFDAATDACIAAAEASVAMRGATARETSSGGTSRPPPCGGASSHTSGAEAWSDRADVAERNLAPRDQTLASRSRDVVIAGRADLRPSSGARLLVACARPR